MLTFSPSHNLTLADLSPSDIVPVIEAWTRIYSAHLDPKSPLASLALPTTIPPSSHADIAKPNAQYRYMQIFENKGAAMGCSNPHPHGQIWTTTGTPEEPGLELVNMQKYCKDHGGKHMLEDYAALEAEKKERIVFENKTFIALCPWWAVWPFEVMIVSKKHKRALVDLDEGERADLAEAFAEVTRRYDNLFETQFPYSEWFAISLHEIVRRSPAAANKQQAWAFTRLLYRVQRRRLRHPTSTSTSTHHCFAVQLFASSWSAMSC